MIGAPIFNDYDESGARLNVNGCRSTRIQDDAIVRNLRQRWSSELSDMSDVALINEYDQFAGSDWFGDNDERFLEYLKEFAS